MKRAILYTLLLALGLSGCGQRAETTPPATQDTPTAQEQTTTTSATTGDQNPTAEELGRPEKADLTFIVEGETDTVPATLYIGQGYSIYIPDTGWRLDRGLDDGIPEETWESTLNDDVELTVSHYGGVTQQQAREAFAADNNDYLFEDLLGGEWGNPLVGIDDDGDRLAFMSTEGNGAVYIVSWKYPAAAAEGFGARLAQIAETFELMN